MRKLYIIPFLLFISIYSFSQTDSKRSTRPADLYRLDNVGNPVPSPDGKWFIYTLSKIDSIKDKRSSTLWMISYDGKVNIQLTSDGEGESDPKWSPDGKWISFLSSRQESKSSQLWLMDRRGGEGKKLTDVKSGINEYEWSPDGKKLLLIITDQEPEDSSKIKTTKPYVIDRFQYKEDVEGYRYKKLYNHLYLFDLDTKKMDTLTSGPFNESQAKWSPDGREIVFVSNHTEDPDKNVNTDIYTILASPHSTIKQITYWTGSDNNPRWSPDGKWIAYTRSTNSSDYNMYDQPVLAVVSKEGGEPKLLSLAIDRPVFSPRWSLDGSEIYCLVEDDRRQYVASFNFNDGKMQRIADGLHVVTTIEPVSAVTWVISMTDPQTPNEIYVLEMSNDPQNPSIRRLTHHSDRFTGPLNLARVEGFNSKSSDGTMVSGLLYLPANAIAGKKLPLILFIHGGPVGQDSYSFDLTRQMLAGGGYAVAAVNYRGSSGRGLAYCKIISADWGNKEVIDLHGAVDELIKKGIADPEKLGVGGWSYGGILTDYLIASDNRFKAACSGAGTGFTLSLYGVDQYINQYINEIGPPWKNIQTYLKISYPLLKADRIKTPTLFFSGDKDFNVPTAGSEQMYQSLRTLGIPTELIIYPGQFHGISLPSYQRDRFDRYLAWYDKYLKQ